MTKLIETVFNNGVAQLAQSSRDPAARFGQTRTVNGQLALIREELHEVLTADGAAPLGQSQYDYEPERVVARGSQVLLGNRLGALDNGVVPQQAFPIFYHLYQHLCAEQN